MLVERISLGGIAALPTMGNVSKLDLSQDLVGLALDERSEKYETIRKMYETVEREKEERDPRAYKTVLVERGRAKGSRPHAERSLSKENHVDRFRGPKRSRND